MNPAKLFGRGTKMMRFKAVLFDLDGTLLDTLEDIADAANRVLVKNGFPVHPRDAYRYFVGSGSAILIRRALPAKARSESTIQRCLEGFLLDYGKNWKVKTAPYAGIPEMLDALVKMGIRLAVLSNKPHRYTLECIDQLLDNWRFEVVLGQRPNVARKPDPAGALETAELMNLSPGEFLYLGDTAIDMKTATAAGMAPIGALWGFRPDELTQGGGSALIRSPLEILPWFTTGRGVSPRPDSG